MVYLARLLPNNEFLGVDKVDAPEGIRVTIDLGERFPLVVAAKGKAYLTQLPEREARKLLERHGLPAYTEHSITDVDTYLTELRSVRHRGWASSRREYYGGASAIAATLRGTELFICSMGSEDRFPPARMEELGPRILDLARVLEK
ncbi:MAG: hypothetical protein LBJ87_09310, partial [bacterium]|nr:hypothetical protein [bacterium]